MHPPGENPKKQERIHRKVENLTAVLVSRFSAFYFYKIQNIPVKKYNKGENIKFM